MPRAASLCEIILPGFYDDISHLGATLCAMKGEIYIEKIELNKIKVAIQSETMVICEEVKGGLNRSV